VRLTLQRLALQRLWPLLQTLRPVLAHHRDLRLVVLLVDEVGGAAAEEKARKKRLEHLIVGPLAWCTAAVVLFGFVYISSAW
jgi:hypothetical protein